MWLTTNGNDERLIFVESLDWKAAQWGAGSKPTVVEGVHVDPHLVQFKGRVSGVIDAEGAGLRPRDAAGLRPDHERADFARFVTEEARQLGPTAFADRYGVALRTATGICTGGRRPSVGTVAKVMALALSETETRTCQLDGCDGSVLRPNQRYCSAFCKSKALSANRRARRTPNPLDRLPTCGKCSAILLGAAVTGPCLVCSHVNGEAIA